MSRVRKQFSMEATQKHAKAAVYFKTLILTQFNCHDSFSALFISGSAVSFKELFSFFLKVKKTILCNYICTYTYIKSKAIKDKLEL